MAHRPRARPASRRNRIRRLRVACLLVVVAVMVATLAHELSASSASTAAQPAQEGRREQPRVPGEARAEGRRALGEADGAVPDGTSVFDDAVPAVANLDSALLQALRRAASDAAAFGVELVVDSGWRSAEYQEHLLREAVSKYGSRDEAARWVAPPETSAHVSGDAADIGPSRAAAWLSDHGARYGLCRIYANEPWHFELRREALGRECPSMYSDAAHDPRMRP